MAIPFIATEISGLLLPSYASAAANKKYVDQIVAATSGGFVGDWGAFSAGDSSIAGMTGTYAISSSSGDALSITVSGYDTISSAALYARDEINASGTEWSSAYASIIASGEKWTKAYGDIVSSGEKWYKAYQSGTKALYDVIQDTTPQLGGDLDGQNIFGLENMTFVEAVGISGTNLKLGATTKINSILDQDGFDSDSATALATQQSIKAYIQEISGNLASKAPISGWEAFTSATDGGIDGMTGTYSISGDAALEISVAGYSTISSQAKYAYDSVLESGTKYHSAYLSAQSIKNGALIKVASGWALKADGENIAHGLLVKPNHVTLTPSGAVTFATAFTIDATNITVRMSAAGSRMLNWRAEV